MLCHWSASQRYSVPPNHHQLYHHRSFHSVRHGKMSAERNGKMHQNRQVASATLVLGWEKRKKNEWKHFVAGCRYRILNAEHLLKTASFCSQFVTFEFILLYIHTHNVRTVCTVCIANDFLFISHFHVCCYVMHVMHALFCCCWINSISIHALLFHFPHVFVCFCCTFFIFDFNVWLWIRWWWLFAWTSHYKMEMDGACGWRWAKENGSCVLLLYIHISERKYGKRNIPFMNWTKKKTKIVIEHCTKLLPWFGWYEMNSQHFQKENTGFCQSDFRLPNTISNNNFCGPSFSLSYCCVCDDHIFHHI